MMEDCVDVSVGAAEGVVELRGVKRAGVSRARMGDCACGGRSGF